ncbi:MAG: ECF transporter S component [Candidatus Caldatribacteriota bacterium]|nr:ECF transporter S component [Candidatus Caldatribacteriota bacterium]
MNKTSITPLFKLTTRQMAISGMLGAIAILLGVTRLGFIPVPTPAGHATIMHIPAILGGILEGPVVGALTGLIFGIYSFTNATNPIFADPLIAILPRIFIGVTSYYAYKYFRKSTILAAVVGTLTNTVGVLGLATLRGYLPAKVSLTVGFVHGTPEVIVAALLITVLVKALKKLGY